jgi:tripartite-type tricarboxylate transporter receptor subunit TctC
MIAMMRSVLAIAMFLLAFANAHAQQWPQRPITLTHGFGAGGNADSLSRLVAGALAESLGVAVIVDAKPGAAATSRRNWCRVPRRMATPSYC